MNNLTYNFWMPILRLPDAHLTSAGCPSHERGMPIRQTQVAQPTK